MSADKLKMGILDALSFRKKTIPYGTVGSFIPTGLNRNDINRIINILGSNSATRFDTHTVMGQADALTRCSILQSICEKTSKYFQAGELEVERTDSDNGKVDAALLQLIASPNPLQTWTELEQQIITYLKVYGYAPLYRIMPANRSTGTPTALWCVNPETFTYKLTGKQWNQSTIQGIVEDVRFQSYGGTQTILKGEDLSNVWVINYGSIPTTLSINTDMYTSASPIYGLRDQLSLFQTVCNVYPTLIAQSILGIISNRSKDQVGFVKLDDESKNALNDKLRNDYGVAEGKNNYVIANRDVFFQSLLTNISNLQMPEGIRIAVNEICNKLDFPVELLANKDITYENKQQAEIAFYEDSIMPFAKHIYHSISAFICPPGTVIYRSYDDISALQTDAKKRAEVNQMNTTTYTEQYNKGIITKNQMLSALGYDMIEGGDIYVYEEKKQPLAVTLGVGGTQAMQMILVDTTLTPDQKVGVLTVVFGVSEQDARTMLNI